MDTVRGFDISSNNHDGSVFNFLEAKDDGYEFVYVKATQGNNYLNPYLIADVRDAANNGLKVGVYHFYDANNGTPEEQAEWFIKNGISQVAEWCALIPVLDFESVENSALRDRFLTAMKRACGVYMNRSYQEAINYGGDSAFGWLAWPEWNGTEALPVKTSVVQLSQKTIAGIGSKPCDTDQAVNYASIQNATPTPTPTPDPTEGVDKHMVSTTVLENGDIVTYVLLPSNEHLLEVTRKAGTVGEPGTAGWSIIDVTDEFGSVVPA